MNVNLLCPEAPFGERMDSNFAEVDETLTKDDRVMENMLMLERSTIPHFNYFLDFQSDLLPFMRKVVTTWMLEVCEEQHCEEQVFPLAVNFMDRFLCECAIPRQQLQLVGATALLVSTKIRQCHSLTVHLLCAYTDHSVAPEEIRTMEVLILTKLNWNPNAITGFDFVDHLIERMPWGDESRLTKRHAHTLVSVCCTEPEFMQTAPSLLATACVCAAVRGLNLRSSERALVDLCAVSSADIGLAELMVCHIERVVANETAALQPQQNSDLATNNEPYYYSVTPPRPKTPAFSVQEECPRTPIRTHPPFSPKSPDDSPPAEFIPTSPNYSPSEEMSTSPPHAPVFIPTSPTYPPSDYTPTSPLSPPPEYMQVSASYSSREFAPTSPSIHSNSFVSKYYPHEFVPNSPMCIARDFKPISPIYQAESVVPISHRASTDCLPTKSKQVKSSLVPVSPTRHPRIGSPIVPPRVVPRSSACSHQTADFTSSSGNSVMRKGNNGSHSANLKHGGKCGNTPTDVQNVDF